MDKWSKMAIIVLNWNSWWVRLSPCVRALMHHLRRAKVIREQVGNLEEGLSWVDQARAGLKTSRDCLENGNYYYSAFFTRQSAEKALKGFLYSKRFRALVTHSVVELLEESAKLVEPFKNPYGMW